MAAAPTVVLKHGDEEAGETQTSSREADVFARAASVGALMLEDMLGTAAGAGAAVAEVESKVPTFPVESPGPTIDNVQATVSALDQGPPRRRRRRLRHQEAGDKKSTASVDESINEACSNHEVKDGIHQMNEAELAAVYQRRHVDSEEAREEEIRLRLRLSRKQLIDRLDLEVELSRGLLVLVFNMLLFVVVIGLMLASSGQSSELGLRHTYVETLGLAELPSIKTSSALKDFMRGLSSKTQSILPASQAFFEEDEGM